MKQVFPPTSQYPQNYDSDYTLLNVYNTTESILTKSAEQFDTTLYIKPVDADKPEIWADNGYATISGEVLYYENVSKDQYTSKVNGLLNCLRNIGGKSSKFNPAGTDIRGFVMAEHHNQLARAIVNTENFIGYTENPDQATVDWRIRNLAALPQIGDDSGCPDVTFYYNTVSSSPVTGTEISYEIVINGNINSFVLDFGDGTTDSNSLIGTHTYPPNFVVDPVLTVINQNCSTVVSGIVRNNIGGAGNLIDARTPTTVPTLPIPTALTPGPFPIVTANCDPVIINFPPIVFPNFFANIGPIFIPSTINITPDLNIPSVITVTPFPNIPSFISVSPFPNIPSLISVTPIIVTGNVNFDLNDCFTIRTGGINIRSSCTANPYPANFTIAGSLCNGTPSINKMTVEIESLKIFKPSKKLGDVRILVVGPDGTAVLLLAIGENQYTVADYVDITFDDSSTNYILPVNVDTPLVSGTYHPSPNGHENISLLAPAPPAPYKTGLSSFQNINPDGQYEMYVQKFNSDTGYDTCDQIGIIGRALINICVSDNICFGPTAPSSPASAPVASPSSPIFNPGPAAGPSYVSPSSPSFGPIPPGPAFPPVPASPGFLPPGPPNPTAPHSPSATPTYLTPSFNPYYPSSCKNCMCRYIFSVAEGQGEWVQATGNNAGCRKYGQPADGAFIYLPCDGDCVCRDASEIPVSPVQNIGDIVHIGCKSYCGQNCRWRWNSATETWDRLGVSCANVGCSCAYPKNPGTTNGQLASTGCFNEPGCPNQCQWQWDPGNGTACGDVPNPNWRKISSCIGDCECYCLTDLQAPTGPGDQQRYTRCWEYDPINTCTDVPSGRNDCSCQCLWSVAQNRWNHTGDGCLNWETFDNSICDCCNDCNNVCLTSPPPSNRGISNQYVYRPCVTDNQCGCGYCTAICASPNNWVFSNNTCGPNCTCPSEPTEPCTPETYVTQYLPCVPTPAPSPSPTPTAPSPTPTAPSPTPTAPSPTPTAPSPTPSGPVANCLSCFCDQKCIGGVWKPFSACNDTPPTPLGCIAACSCPDINEGCPTENAIRPINCQPVPPSFAFNATESNIYFAVKDPLLTNNKCECLNININDAGLYFENLGLFDNLRDCNRFCEKSNLHLIKARDKMKNVNFGVEVYNQNKKTEMKFLKLSELNSSKEIEKIDTNIEEVAVFTPVAKDDVIKFDSKSINIDNIPQIVEIYEDSKTEKENVKNINFTENDSVTEEIKIEKIEIEPITNQSVTNIENNVTPIVNMIKAETVFNKIQDSERESTEFNDRK